MAGREIVEWEQGWNTIRQKFFHWRNQDEDERNNLDYIIINRTIKKMINQRAPYNYSAKLYDEYVTLLKEFIQSTVTPSLRGNDRALLFSNCAKSFSDYRDFMEDLLVFFRQLPTLRNRLKPHEAAVKFFTDLVYKPIEEELLQMTADMMNQERERVDINNRDLNLLLAETPHFKLYDHFCTKIFETTTVYYTQKALGWLEKSWSWKGYISEAHHCLVQEEFRVDFYLPTSRKTELIKQLRHELLLTYLRPLWEKGRMDANELGAEKLEDFSWFFSPKVPEHLEDVARNFKQYVTDTGIVLFKKTGRSIAEKKMFVSEVLALHEKFTTYVNDYLLNHNLFEETLSEALTELFTNDVSGSSSVQLLAIFCDEILERASSKSCNEVTRDTLNQVSKLVVCLPREEEFYELYWKQFAVRLLTAQYPYNESEKMMLAKFPYLQRFKLEKMIRKGPAIVKIKVLLNLLNISETPDANLGIDFEITVLESGRWPMEKHNIKLPPEMATCCKLYDDFFEKKNRTEATDLEHNKEPSREKHLKWLLGMGTCHIETEIGGKKVELIVTTAQAAVLELFNASDMLRCDEIMSQLNLSHADAAQLLHSLSTCKCQILQKQTDTIAISRTDIFVYNPTFSPEMGKVMVPRPSDDTIEDKLERSVEIVMPGNVTYAIDASIVRIMKHRKVLTYDELVAECIRQLRNMYKPTLQTLIVGLGI